MAGVSVATSVSAQAISGDFNADGKADILWRNRATGQNVVWLMNGTALTNTVSLVTVSDLSWRVGWSSCNNRLMALGLRCRPHAINLYDDENQAGNSLFQRITIRGQVTRANC